VTQKGGTANLGPGPTGALTWNANGSLAQLSIVDPFNTRDNGQTCVNTHADLGRISQVNCVNGDWGQNFGYDPFGNITKSQFGTYSNGTFQPTYDQTTNRCSALMGHNLTFDGAHNYAWDADGNLNKLDSAAAIVYL